MWDNRSTNMMPMREPPVYRPFAFLALGATVVGGTPLGMWMLAWLYWGFPAVPVEWILLHAHLQVFGFFSTLIPGVAPHLAARFTGRPLVPPRMAPWLAAAFGAALSLRLAGTVAHGPVLILSASLVQAGAFLYFAAWIRRALDAPPLASLRRHLVASTGWFAAACLLEAVLRWQALGQGATVPAPGGMQAVYAISLFGGVLGWVTGVLLRAGPMFVPGWSPSGRAVHVLPWILALGVVSAFAGEVASLEPSTASALARLGECVALGGAVWVLLGGGGLRRIRGTLPMAARSPEEARIFRLAVLSAAAAVPGSALAAAAEWAGWPIPLLTDAVRHLVTVGFLASVVVAMAFRLIPALERTPLPWPRLRTAAVLALVAGVAIRTAEMLVGLGWVAVAAAIPLSGVLVWVALASVGVNLVGTIARAARTAES